MARFGSIGTQYFDDSGRPLSGGTLTFYESGTTTAKNTYSDVALTIPNTNPVVLDAAGRQADIFFNGAAKCVLKDSAGVQIDVADPVGDAVSRVAFAPYSGLITYSLGDIVTYDGLYYRSLANANTGNTPDSSPSEWALATLLNVDADEADNLEDLASVTPGAKGKAILADNTNDEVLTELGGTTVGKAFFAVPNPSAIRFPRVNADNSMTLRSAADFRNDIGASVLDLQKFPTSGTWNKPAGAKFVLVELWGAGGGGAGGEGAVNVGDTITHGGGGGGGGRYVAKLYDADALPASISIIIGAGGAGGAGGTVTSAASANDEGDNGGNGGTTMFGAIRYAYGGGGGLGSGAGGGKAGDYSAASGSTNGTPDITGDQTYSATGGAGVDAALGEAGLCSMLGGSGGGSGGSGQGGGDINGRDGGSGGVQNNTALKGGATNGGTAPGGAGGDGSSFQGGGGGGGVRLASSSGTRTGGAGGNGGAASGGGGGGAAEIDFMTASSTATGGAGGDGGNGFARITTW